MTIATEESGTAAVARVTPSPGTRRTRSACAEANPVSDSMAKRCASLISLVMVRSSSVASESVVVGEPVLGRRIRVGADAPILVDVGDRLHLIGREGEVEDVEVLTDPLRVRGLRDRDVAELHMPAQDDLSDRA